MSWTESLRSTTDMLNRFAPDADDVAQIAIRAGRSSDPVGHTGKNHQRAQVVITIRPAPCDVQG